MGLGHLEGKRVLVTLPLTEAQRQEFSEICEGASARVTFIREGEVTGADVEGVSVIVGNVPADSLRGSECLEWLQTSSAGYDHYLASGRLSAQTLLTNATGAYGQAVSEHMLASLMCLMKKLHLYRDNQRVAAWKDEGPVSSLVGAHVLVLGAGDIGTSFACLATALGAHAWGVRRNANACHAPFERMVSLAEVKSVLGEVDVVACVLPSSPETRGLADASFFAAMRAGSYFLNAGRGDLADLDALADALSTGHLAGAALDVTSPEPLPQDHVLWKEPRALITPHVAGFWHLKATTDKVIAICRENLVAYLEGKPLKNVVRRDS